MSVKRLDFSHIGPVSESIYRADAAELIESFRQRDRRAMYKAIADHCDNRAYEAWRNDRDAESRHHYITLANIFDKACA